MKCLKISLQIIISEELDSSSDELASEIMCGRGQNHYVVLLLLAKITYSLKFAKY